MRPIFTVHAGEFLVGSELQRKFKRLNLWIPVRDTGVDLLVSNRKATQCVSLQVKFSRDFLVTHEAAEFQKALRACGWWTIDTQKLRASQADYWIFVLQGFERRSTDFVVIPPRDLRRRLRTIHGPGSTVQFYLWVTESERCWATRGLKRVDHRSIAGGTFKSPSRDLTRWLNNWSPLAKLNR